MVKSGQIAKFVDDAVKLVPDFQVDLQRSTSNSASGDSIVESVLINLQRDVFPKCFLETPLFYRKKWVAIAKQITREHPIFAAFDEQLFSAKWDLLSTQGVYDVDLFGDVILPVIAHCIKKDILVFEVSVNRSLPFIVPASGFGAEADSAYPVVLCYNGVHYESLIPTDCTLHQTIVVKNECLSGSITANQLTDEQKRASEVFLCSVCGLKLRKNCPSILCTICLKWCHVRKKTTAPKLKHRTSRKFKISFVLFA